MNFKIFYSHTILRIEVQQCVGWEWRGGGSIARVYMGTLDISNYIFHRGGTCIASQLYMRSFNIPFNILTFFTQYCVLTNENA